MKTSSYLFSIVSFFLAIDKSNSFIQLSSSLSKWQGDDPANKLNPNNFGNNGDFNIYSKTSRDFSGDDSEQNEDDWLSSCYRNNRQKKSETNFEENEKKPKNSKDKVNELASYYKKIKKAPSNQIDIDAHEKRLKLDWQKLIKSLIEANMIEANMIEDDQQNISREESDSSAEPGSLRLDFSKLEKFNKESDSSGVIDYSNNPAQESGGEKLKETFEKILEYKAQNNQSAEAIDTAKNTDEDLNHSGTEFDYYDGPLGGEQGLPDHLE